MKVRIEMNKRALYEVSLTDISEFKCALKLTDYYERTLCKPHFATRNFCFEIC
jgi:hypothetical protein